MRIRVERPFRRDFALACLAGAACSAPAFGSITATTGAAVQIPTPADARLDVVTSLTEVRVWDEQQNFLLTNDLRVDAIAAGIYDSPEDLPAVQPIIPAGTVVSSHFIHLDTPGFQNVPSLSGSITFDQDVIGLILVGDGDDSPKTLDLSDYLGAPTLYDDNTAGRSVDIDVIGSADIVTLSADLRTVTFTMGASQPGDRFRVVTVPEPTSLACLVTLLLPFVAGPRGRRV